MTEHYPRVLSATDDRGHAFTAVDGDFSFRPVDTGEELRPGDTVTFTLEAVDPKGRDVQWTIGIGSTSIELPTVTGTSATVTWSVTDAAVRDDAAVVFQMSALDTPYHRNGNYDEQIEFYYKVSPPLDA